MVETARGLLRIGGFVRLPVQLGGVPPETLEVVQLAGIIGEDVQHYVAIVTQDPIAVLAFDVAAIRMILLHQDPDFLGNGVGLPLVVRGGDDEVVEQRGSVREGKLKEYQVKLKIAVEM